MRDMELIKRPHHGQRLISRTSFLNRRGICPEWRQRRDDDQRDVLCSQIHLSSQLRYGTAAAILDLRKKNLRLPRGFSCLRLRFCLEQLEQSYQPTRLPTVEWSE